MTEGWSFALEPASLDKMAFPLPDTPSIAVPPFENLGDDSKQEYIGDGITETIIAALSKIFEMFALSLVNYCRYLIYSVRI
jgi:TolB-like protein